MLDFPTGKMMTSVSHETDIGLYCVSNTSLKPRALVDDEQSALKRKFTDVFPDVCSGSILIVGWVLNPC